MGAAAEVKVEVELTTDVWTDITADTLSRAGLRIRYGIAGNGPLDLVARTGQCRGTLQNHAGNSAGTQGYYSPLHGSALSGWTVGTGIRVVFYRASDTTQAITSVTRSGATATVTTTAPHGLATDAWVTIAGADQTEYNGSFKITQTGASTFTFTVPGTPASPATGTVTWRRAYVKHRGKVSRILPEAGSTGRQRVPFVSYDCVRDLARTSVREVGLQVDKSEDELLDAVLDSLPAALQPLARNFDAGVDTYPYAFDRLGRGAKALSVIQDIAESSFALVPMLGDGTLRMFSRHARATAASSYTFSEGELIGLTVPADVDRVRNPVRVTIRPRTVDAAATTVVYSTVGTPVSVSPGDPVTMWVEYRDPDETRELIGALEVVDPLVANTDYAGNSQEDGLGTDLTSDLSVVITPFASSAKLVITATGTDTIYLVDGSGDPFLQIRAKGVYDLGPQTYESDNGATASKPLEFDLKYAADVNVAQAYAEFISQQHGVLVAQPSRQEFDANKSDDLLEQALAREPGDVITLSETMTGVSSLEAVIQSVELIVTPGPWIRCRWGLAPAAPFRAWLFGVAGRGEFAQETRLGF